MEQIKETPLPFLSFSQTMQALDCSRSFIYELINSHKIKPKYLGRKPYFLKEEIIGALEEGATK